LELFDLEADPSETTDLAGKYPQKVQELSRQYNAWLDQMAEPSSGQGKRRTDKTQSQPQDERQKQRLERRQQRKDARSLNEEDA
jgi:hypothetical protein